MSNVDWAAYDKALKRRGSISFWMSDEAQKGWYAEATGGSGAFVNLDKRNRFFCKLYEKRAQKFPTGV